MDRQPWIFPFLVGALIATVICKWSVIVGLYTHRREIDGAGKIIEGLRDLGVTQ